MWLVIKRWFVLHELHESNWVFCACGWGCHFHAMLIIDNLYHLCSSHVKLWIEGNKGVAVGVVGGCQNLHSFVCHSVIYHWFGYVSKSPRINSALFNQIFFYGFQPFTFGSLLLRGV